MMPNSGTHGPTPSCLTGARTDNVGHPRFGGTRAHSRVEVKAIGNEGVDTPAGAERSTQLALGDAAGPQSPGWRSLKHMR